MIIKYGPTLNYNGVVCYVFNIFICLYYRMSCNTNVIHVQLSCVRDAQRVPVHLMPCEIEHNGPAQVSQYFNAVTKDCKQGTHTSK